MMRAGKKGRGGKREGAGRKRELDDGTIKSVVLDKATLQYIEKYCASRNIGVSAAIRQLLLHAIEIDLKGIDDIDS